MSAYIPHICVLCAVMALGFLWEWRSSRNPPIEAKNKPPFWDGKLPAPYRSWPAEYRCKRCGGTLTMAEWDVCSVCQSARRKEYAVEPPGYLPGRPLRDSERRSIDAGDRGVVRWKGYVLRAATEIMRYRDTVWVSAYPTDASGRLLSVETNTWTCPVDEVTYKADNQQRVSLVEPSDYTYR